MSEFNKDSKLNWIETYTGGRFYPFDPKEEDINILDIAHALSFQCRFSGHTKIFYSVAEHSILVANLVSEKNKLAALLHDAAEAYIGDLAKPIKCKMPYFNKVEHAIKSVIYNKYNITLTDEDKEEIKDADNIALFYEATCLLDNVYDWYMADKYIPRINQMLKENKIIFEIDNKAAEERFLKDFETYKNILL